MSRAPAPDEFETLHFTSGVMLTLTGSQATTDLPFDTMRCVSRTRVQLSLPSHKSTTSCKEEPEEVRSNTVSHSPLLCFRFHCQGIRHAYVRVLTCIVVCSALIECLVTLLQERGQVVNDCETKLARRAHFR